MYQGLFSNYWWATVASDYSVTIVLLGSTFITLLKLLAILNPGNKTDSIICLLKGWLYGFPGMKDEKQTYIHTTSNTQESLNKSDDF